MSNERGEVNVVTDYRASVSTISEAAARLSSLVAAVVFATCFLGDVERIRAETDGGATGDCDTPSNEWGDDGCQWVDTVGTPGEDEARDGAVDGDGHLFVGGTITGRMGLKVGPQRTGFVATYDDTGARKWVRLVGGEGVTAVSDVEAGPAGSVYVAGRTGGRLGPDEHSGSDDAFVAKFEDSGDRKWLRLAGSWTRERVSDLTVEESGDAYLLGTYSNPVQLRVGVFGGVLAKFGASGKRNWTTLFGAEFTAPFAKRYMSLALVSGALYVSGENHPERGTSGRAENGFLASFERSGEARWLRHVTGLGRGRRWHVLDGPEAGLRVVGASDDDLEGCTSDASGTMFRAEFGKDGEQRTCKRLELEEGGASSPSEMFVSDGGTFVTVDYVSASHDATRRPTREPSLAAYDAEGRRQWERTLDPPHSGVVGDVVIDDGSEWTWVLGSHRHPSMETSERRQFSAALATKFRSDTSTKRGRRVWVRAYGSSGALRVRDAAPATSGAVYVVGERRDAGGEPEERSPGFVRKYDASGDPSWTASLGVQSRGVAVGPGGDVFVAGVKPESSGGDRDAFLAKYDGSGERTWVETFGTAKTDRGLAVGVAKAGAVYVAGSSAGDLGGEDNAGGDDAFVARYDSSGAREWVRLAGTSNDDVAHRVVVGESGTLRVAGLSDGDLGDSTRSQDRNGFVAVYDAGGSRKQVKSLWQSAHNFLVRVAASGSNVGFSTTVTGSPLRAWKRQETEDVFVARVH